MAEPNRIDKLPRGAAVLGGIRRAMADVSGARAAVRGASYEQAMLRRSEPIRVPNGPSDARAIDELTLGVWRCLRPKLTAQWGGISVESSIGVITATT